MSESLSALQKFTVARSVIPHEKSVLTVEGTGILVQFHIDDQDARQILEEILGFLGFPAEASSAHPVTKIRPA